MIIHQLAPSDKSKWDPIWEKCHSSILKLPYEVKVWSDEQVDNELKDDDEHFYNEYLSVLHPIYKWDYVRYIILERYGGAYIDMDVEIVQDFFPLLNPNKCYIKEGHNGSYLENSIMVSLNKGTTLWLRAKDYCRGLLVNNFEMAKQSKDYTIDLVGPTALAKFFAYHVREREVTYNTKLFEILAHEHFGSLTNEVSFARHYNRSWWTR